MNYFEHLKLNWIVAGHALKDAFAHFVHGIIPEIKIKHHQPNEAKIKPLELRKCSHCGKEMSVGYCIRGGEEYYCSDDCLHEHYSEEEYLELYDNGNGDSYWTEWED